MIVNKTSLFSALRKNDGTFILNGNWAINWSGEFDALGTKFSYHREDEGSAETITSPGPLAEPLDLMVLYSVPLPFHELMWKKRVETARAVSRAYCALGNVDAVSLILECLGGVKYPLA